MPLIKSINNITPKILEGVFLADNAVVVGDVIIGKESSVWFNTVIRGDVNSIIIGNSVNIQDGVVVHCTYQKTKTIIGDNVSIGHNAIIHGCEIRNNVLIGMGAIIMDNVIIEENSIIAAGAVLTKGTYVKSGSLFAGVPAKFKRSLFEEEIENSIIKTAENYKKYLSWYN
ncbi:MAG: gamma carbonic anhydrase family protein [Flavobacteriales bacterium]|tara:strand:- start:1311 stop:1823 length:513 start_codon:yes stop_codon:yes gene_type:complete